MTNPTIQPRYVLLALGVTFALAGGVAADAGMHGLSFGSILSAAVLFLASLLSGD